MKAFWVVFAMAAGVVAVAPAEAQASSGSAELFFSNDLLTGLVIALGCALFSAVLRRLPSN